MTDNEFDANEFRFACASFVKYLLAAREKDEPGFMSDEMHQRWDPNRQFPDGNRSVAQFLRLADKSRRVIDVRYFEPGGSIGIGQTAHSSVEELQLDITFLVVHENGLQDAIGDVEAGREVDWEALVNWDKLPAIRAALDKLPSERPLPADQGVTVFDVALAIEEDDIVARATVKEWIDSKRIEAEPIGKCPVDGRRQLYRLSELLSDVTKILRLSAGEKARYRAALGARQRVPRE